MNINRGDIVIVELNPTEGSEQQGVHRPCVVIQNDVGNEFSPTTIVAPFTKQYDSDDIYPFEVQVLAAETPLKNDSVADLSQIRVVDIDSRVNRVIGSLSASKMTQIDRAIENSLGL
ncbi:type II toxin-antitoxin system PemK/MazF family toxin [Halodesulfurarchaeum sp.]|uniref:type II toxin-antitoxin system PemK/MazF family toxin n=1 Tax=Halodesulfurarchaeum sp. TaxID=1980530 RepID=UPI002FC389D0